MAEQSKAWHPSSSIGVLQPFRSPGETFSTATSRPWVTMEERSTWNSPGCSIQAPQFLWSLQKHFRENKAKQKTKTEVEFQDTYLDLCLVSKTNPFLFYFFNALFLLKFLVLQTLKNLGFYLEYSRTTRYRVLGGIIYFISYL